MIKSKSVRHDELILKFDMISDESLPHCVWNSTYTIPWRVRIVSGVINFLVCSRRHLNCSFSSSLLLSSLWLLHKHIHTPLFKFRFCRCRLIAFFSIKISFVVWLLHSIRDNDVSPDIKFVRLGQVSVHRHPSIYFIHLLIWLCSSERQVIFIGQYDIESRNHLLFL